jgi:hypothetical protein
MMRILLAWLFASVTAGAVMGIMLTDSVNSTSVRLLIGLAFGISVGLIPFARAPAVFPFGKLVAAIVAVSYLAALSILAASSDRANEGTVIIALLGAVALFWVLTRRT